MRENTRCEVEEPISTPTLRTTISSSSTSERPVLEKKIRPPTSSSVIVRHGRTCSGHPRLSWIVGRGEAQPSLRRSRKLALVAGRGMPRPYSHNKTWMPGIKQHKAGHDD